MFEESNEANIGVVIQNLDGEVMGALLEKISMPSSVETLESLVARRVVLFVHEMSLNQSVFEEDSLQRGAMSSSTFGHLIQDFIFYQLSLSLSLFLSFFLERSFFHSVRQSNVVTHALTRRKQDLLFYFKFG